MEVDSSMIASVEYDPSNHVLTIQFRKGRTYQYQDVEPEVYAELVQAPSIGRYFLEHIRGKYNAG
jgi:hypothetical protein